MHTHSFRSLFVPARFTNRLARILRGACIVSAALALGACATSQKIDVRPEIRQQLTEVTIIEMPGPFRHWVLGVDPLPTSIGPFEVELEVETPLAVGIAAAGAAVQTSSLTSAVKPFFSKGGAVYAREIEAELVKRGVKVTRMAAPANFKLSGFDYGTVNITTSYILEATLHTSYQLRDGLLSPVVISRVRLLDRTGKQEHYKNAFLYAIPNDPDANATLIEPDEKYLFNDLKSLYANGKTAAEAFHTGIKQIALNVGQQLK
jgi:hypothetical protein